MDSEEGRRAGWVSTGRQFMYPHFKDVEIECWKHSGKLGVSKPTVCLFHKAPEQGGILLEALDDLQFEGFPSQRAVHLTPSGRKQGVSTLRLRFVLVQSDLRVLNIACTTEAATFEMTSLGIEVVRSAIDSWCNGREDFGVSSSHAKLKKRELGARDKNSGELWFWGPYYSGP